MTGWWYHRTNVFFFSLGIWCQPQTRRKWFTSYAFHVLCFSECVCVSHNLHVLHCFGEWNSTARFVWNQFYFGLLFPSFLYYSFIFASIFPAELFSDILVRYTSRSKMELWLYNGWLNIHFLFKYLLKFCPQNITVWHQCARQNNTSHDGINIL